MVHAFYTKDKTYYVERCTEDDIEKHFEKIADKIADTPTNIYIDKMMYSVHQCNAFKLKDSFLYLYKDNNQWYGASVYADKILDLVMLMVSTSELLEYKKIKFTPHEGMISRIKSLLDGESIRRFRTDGKYVTVRVDDLKEKFAKLFERIGVTYERCS